MEDSSVIICLMISQYAVTVDLPSWWFHSMLPLLTFHPDGFTVCYHCWPSILMISQYAITVDLPSWWFHSMLSLLTFHPDDFTVCYHCWPSILMVSQYAVTADLPSWWFHSMLSLLTFHPQVQHWTPKNKASAPKKQTKLRLKQILSCLKLTAKNVCKSVCMLYTCMYVY